MTDTLHGCSDDATVRLGEFLVCIGAMTQDEVGQVLEKQKQDPDKLFGQIAIEMGLIDDAAVDAYLQHKRESAPAT
jgi:hypothetical protein